MSAWSALEGVDIATVQDARREHVFHHVGPRGALRLLRAGVSTNYFRVLGVAPVRGRDFASSDAGTRSVILSHDAAVRVFGSIDAAVIGSELVLNGAVRELVGIMPARLVVPKPPGHAAPDARIDAWIPLPPSVEADHLLLRAGTEAGLGDRLVRAAQGFEPFVTKAVHTVSLEEVLLGPARRWVNGVALVAAVSLLFAVFTAGGLVFVRFAATTRRTTIHRYFGATIPRLALRSALQSTIIALMASLAAILLATWLLDAVRSAGPAELARLADVELDATAVWVTLLVAAVLGILTGGIPPLLLLPRMAVSNSLMSRGAETLPSLRLVRSGAVVLQLALAFTLATCGVMLVRTLGALDARSPARNPESTLVVDLPRQPGTPLERSKAFYAETLRAIRSLPGVLDAGLASSIPLRPRDYHGPRWSIRIADDGYFRVLGVDLVAGQGFERASLESGDIAIINEALARQEFGTTSPIGRVLDDHRVVGVVRDHVHGRPDGDVDPAMYVPPAQLADSRNSILVATSPAAVHSVAAAIRNAVAAVDPTQPVEEILTLAEIARRSPALSHRVFQRTSLVLLAVLASALAAMGLASVLAQDLADRRREIALRLAIGGPPDMPRRMVLRRTAQLLGLAVLVGFPLAFAFARVIRASLFGVAPLDPASYASVLGGLVLVAAAATIATPAAREEHLVELLRDS